LDADRVVLAAGAWSDLLPGAGPATAPGVRPVKGEMLSFSTPVRPLEIVVTSPRVYLIPRETPGGPVVLAGATEEEAGFDGRLSRRGQGALQSGAEELLPELIGAPVQERWAGFRPGTSDQLPMVGPHPQVAGLYLATGHFRNGILLAPATARLIADRIRWGSSGDPAPGSWAAALDPARVVT
jgi:glycine oxidase